MKKIFFATVLLCLVFGLFSCNGGSAKEGSQAGEEMAGKDRDEHGCVASAGYTWCEVLEACIRPWEAGVKMEDLKSAEKSSGAQFAAYLVFNKDSSKAEVFAVNENTTVLDVKETPDGKIWENGTLSAKQVSGLWTVSRDGEMLFCEVAKNTNQ